MIRTCMVSYKMPPFYGGSGAQALRLAQRLQGKGISVSMLTARHDTSAPPHESVGGVIVHRLSVIRAGRLRPFSFSLAMTWHLLRNHWRYDVVHIHSAYWRIVPLLLTAKLMRKRIIVKMTQFGTDDPMSIRRRRFGTILLSTLAMGDAVIAISDELAASYTQAGLPCDRLFRIPNGVDTDVFRPIDGEARQELRASLGFPPSVPILLFVGAVDWRKGVDLLLRAWPKVREQFPEGILAVVGPLSTASRPHEGRPYREYICEYVDNCGATQHIHLLGQQMDIQRFYQIADIFVLPSRMEGLPNAVLEAMACGLPVVSTTVGGSPEIIEDGVNGLLVPANDADALATAILSYLQHPRRAQEQGLAARKTVLARYPMDGVAERYSMLYAYLLGLGERAQMTPGQPVTSAHSTNEVQNDGLE